MGKCYTIDRGPGEPFGFVVIDGILLENGGFVIENSEELLVPLDVSIESVGRTEFAVSCGYPHDIILVKDIQDEGIVVSNFIPNEAIEIVLREGREPLGLIEEYGMVSHLTSIKSASVYSNALGHNRMGATLYSVDEKKPFSIFRYSLANQAVIVCSFGWNEHSLVRLPVKDEPGARPAPMGL